ncbi:MAG: thioredoxin family protein [Gammaproteobacteria bacterium]|nr:thioredoxin family protein [Gammaproteobacteria bacterium]MDH5802444.1 thioredoxin family protein [Gammaproteobacteria bacterium]
MNVLPKLVLSLLFLSAMVGCSIDDSSLKIGMKAPSLPTKTLADVGGDFSRITTYRYPDKRMYQLSLDVALNSGKTIVLEFATPGHCTVCDKQLQMLKALLVKYEDDVIFLHMDQYQNPQAFKAFGVIGDPWTYIIDANQVVRFKQAGRMLYGELDLILRTMQAANASKQDLEKVAEAG